MRPILSAILLATLLLGTQSASGLPQGPEVKLTVRGLVQLACDNIDGMCYCAGNVCNCDLADPLGCGFGLPVTLGTSCSASGPAGTVCAYTCAGGEHQHVRSHPRWGGYESSAGRAECGGSFAECYGWGWGCSASSGDVPYGLGNTYQGTCTVTVAGSLVSCSSGGAVVPPDPPENLRFEWTSATGGTLSWDAPGFTGGSAVAQYTIYLGQAPVGASATTSFQLVGLDPDTAPTYHVGATNAAGEGAAQRILIEGNTACQSGQYSATCHFRCVPGAIIHLYAYDAVGQLQGNVLSATATCGTASTSCTGVNSCTGVSAPNTGSTDAFGTCEAGANTFVACGAGNVPVVPGPPTNAQAQIVRNCPDGWTGTQTCVTVTWAPPTFNGGGAIDGYIVYKENWYSVHTTFPYHYCGGNPATADSCRFDVAGCTVGDYGDPLKYWVRAWRWGPDGNQDIGPPSNIALTLPC